MIRISRREFARLAGGLAAARGAAGAAARTIGFGFGTYGMQSLDTETALRTIRQIGYDGVELALMPGWPTEPTLLDDGARRKIRALLVELKLDLPSLLESTPLLQDAPKRAAVRERLKRAAELGHALSPAKPPVVETILGGRTAAWDQVKDRMAEELREWAEIGRSTKTVICFKPHAAHAIHSPERTLWMLKQVDSPYIRVIYDYSHFYVEGFPLASSLKQLLPYTPFIHVKDSEGTGEKHTYLLPGEGKTADYAEYFRLLKQYGYGGYVVVEVSAMIHRKPGYEPVPTAKKCYATLAPAFEKAGVKRPRRA